MKTLGSKAHVTRVEILFIATPIVLSKIVFTYLNFTFIAHKEIFTANSRLKAHRFCIKCRVLDRNASGQLYHIWNENLQKIHTGLKLIGCCRQIDQVPIKKELNELNWKPPEFLLPTNLHKLSADLDLCLNFCKAYNYSYFLIPRKKCYPPKLSPIANIPPPPIYWQTHQAVPGLGIAPNRILSLLTEGIKLKVL